MFYKKSVDLNGDTPISKSEGVKNKFSNELPLESELKYFISNMDRKN